jgi:hypothetical protein
MKPTPAQQAILHVLESVVIAFILTIIAGVYQQIGTHGLDFASLAAFAGTAFLGALGTIYKSVLSNPNLPQAEQDTLLEVKALIEQSLPFLHSHPAPVQQQQPPQTQFKAPVAPPASAPPPFTMPMAAMASTQKPGQ